MSLFRRQTESSSSVLHSLGAHNSQSQEPGTQPGYLVRLAGIRLPELSSQPPRICSSWKLESAAPVKNRTQACQKGYRHLNEHLHLQGKRLLHQDLLIMGCIGHCPRLHRSIPQPWVRWTDLHCQHLYLFLSLKAPSLGTAYMQTQSHSASRVMFTKHIHDSVPHLPHWRCCRFTM